VEKPLVIRRIQLEDALEARDLRLRALMVDPMSFGSTYGAEATLSDATWIERARIHAFGDDRAILLALRGAAPIGLVRTQRDALRREVFGIYSVWVAPDERRRGVGAALLRAIEEWILARGGTIAELLVSDPARAARRLYEGSGYVPDGRIEPSPHPDVTERGVTKVLRPGAA
jgi:GNAT superfamily N-acetyltransferase